MKEVHKIICHICGKNRPYAAMLKTDKWKKVISFYNISSRALLCMDCMEKGLQRPFELDDFRLCPLTIEWGIY